MKLTRKEPRLAAPLYSMYSCTWFTVSREKRILRRPINFIAISTSSLRTASLFTVAFFLFVTSFRPSFSVFWFNPKLNGKKWITAECERQHDDEPKMNWRIRRSNADARKKRKSFATVKMRMEKSSLASTLWRKRRTIHCDSLPLHWK